MVNLTTGESALQFCQEGRECGVLRRTLAEERWGERAKGGSDRRLAPAPHLWYNPQVGFFTVGYGMSIVTGQGLGKYYGAQDVFADVEFAIARGDKSALVGPNGAGKTTLLRIILGLEEPSLGHVQRARGLRIGYLPQRPVFPSEQTVYGEMLSIFAALRAQQRELQALAEEMAAADDPSELMQRYAEAEQRFDLAGGYSYEERMARVLGGLGFSADMFCWPIAVLSGGQVTRALLAKLLLQEPELLVLDEPSNYLDLEALEWLEGYLGEWPQSLLVVSHDRYFLDKVVTRVWEMNHGRLGTYRGNYSSYVVQREAHMERLRREYEEQQEQVARTEDFIRRYRAGQRSKQARGRETILERTERVAPPPPTRQIQLRMSSTLRAGDHVLMSEGASIGYETRPESGGTASPAEQHTLFETGEFLVERGQRVALLGANGSGKTTFLRTILGQVEPLAGRIRLGASVRIGYLPQTRDWLDPGKTILEQILAADDKMAVAQARHLMGRFLFSGDDVYKPISTLSGGELSRVALAILTIRGANLLLLDEPTTHLDVESQEVLQSVLTRFSGTILLVSHDRYLMDALATHLWVIEGGRLRQFEGNYSAYVQALERECERERVVRAEESGRPPAAAQRDERRRERQAERIVRQRAQRTTVLESEIARLEGELNTVAGLLELASSSQDLERVRSLSQEYQRLGATLAERMHLWEVGMGSAG